LCCVSFVIHTPVSIKKIVQKIREKKRERKEKLEEEERGCFAVAY